MKLNRKFSVLAALVAVAWWGATSAAHAQTTTVQPGLWFDAATWDNGVPTIADDATIVHDQIFVDFSEMPMAASLTVGNGDAGLLLLDFAADLTVAGDVLIGNAGGAGSILFDFSNEFTAQNVVIGASAEGYLGGEGTQADGEVTATSITVGSGGPGTLRVELSTATTGEYRVGADGSTGNLILESFSDDATAHNGFTLGAQGTLSFNSSFTGSSVVNVTAGDLTFAPGSAITTRGMFVSDGVIIGDRRVLFTYAGNLVGLPTTFEPPLGFGAVLDTATPGEIAMEITSLPGPFEWIAGVENFFTGGNWDAGVAPTAGGFADIRNGGTANADGNDGGAPAEFLLNELNIADPMGNGALNVVNQTMRVGGNGGSLFVASPADEVTSGTVSGIDGSFVFTDATSLYIASDLDVGSLRSAETGQISGMGSAVIERVDEVFVGGDADIGAHIVDNGGGAVADGHGSLIIRDIGTFFLDGDFDITDGEVGEGTGTGRGTAFHSADVLVERVDTFILNALKGIAS